MEEKDKETESAATYIDANGEPRVLRGKIIALNEFYVKLKRRDGDVIIPMKQVVKIKQEKVENDEEKDGVEYGRGE